MKIAERLKKSWPVLVSVALLSLAFPPANFVLLVFVAIAPWLASLRDTDSRGALKSSALFGFLYILFQMFWLTQFLMEWTHQPLLSYLPWLVCGILGAILYLPLGWLIHKCFKLRWTWLIPLVWAGHEGFRAYVLVLAFPWGILANPLWMFPQFVQHAAFGTVFLVSAWLMIPNLALAMILWPEKDEQGEKLPPGPTMVRMALVFGGILMVSAYRYMQFPSGTKKSFTLGQLGIDMAFTPDETRLPAIDAAGKAIEKSALAQGSDLLILPEGFSDNVPNEPPYGPLGAHPQVPVLMGGKRMENGGTLQTAYGYDGQWSFADKTRLVVFGEYVPFRGLPILDGFNIPQGDLTPGKDLKTLTVNGIRIGPLLCFEGVFPDLADRHSRNGAQVLAQMCIDDWYERTPAWTQLWQSSVWRSIESGLPLLRVGGRGQTLATDARGDILVMVEKGITAAQRVDITVPAESDAFQYRMGFVYLSWAVCGVVAAKSWADSLAKRKKK